MKKRKKNSVVMKGLIRIGVFSALMIMVSFLIACTIGYVPVLMLTAMPCIMAVASGMIYMVMLSKLEIAGGLFTTATLLGLCLFNMAPYGFMFFTSLTAGILGEAVYQLLGRDNFKAKVAGVSVICAASAVGEYAPFIWMKEAYLTLYEGNSFGTAPIVLYATEHMNILAMLILTLIVVAFGVLGCFWGNKIVERNMNRKAKIAIQ